MDLFMTLLGGTVQALLAFLQLCMLVRAVLSWFPLRDDNPFVMLVTVITEPIIAPIRALFDRLGWFRDIPIDIPFFVALMLLSVVSTVLTLLL